MTSVDNVSRTYSDTDTITVEPGKTYKFIVESFNSFGDKTGEGSVDITIPAIEIVPANFNSAEAMWSMIQRLIEEE